MGKKRFCTGSPLSGIAATTKLTILLFLGCTFSKTSSAQFPTSIDSLYTFIKYNSVWHNTIDWKPVDAQFWQQIKTAKTIKDTMACFVGVLRSLNDVHSQIYLNSQYYGHYPVFDDSVLARIRPLHERSIAGTNKVYITILSSNIAYIRVPGISAFGTEKINEYAQIVYDSVSRLAAKNPHGFIIDLRLNGGGNVYPMLTGLSALLGNTTVGYETSIDDSIVRKWSIQQGNFYMDSYAMTSIKIIPQPKLARIPVVVLIGPITKSSGSMTAIAFKKRPNTVFMGEATADGYTTSNNYFQYAPGLVLNFATNFVADRAKTIYKNIVHPDVIINDGDNFDDIRKDVKVQRALQWIKQKIVRR